MYKNLTTIILFLVVSLVHAEEKNYQIEDCYINKNFQSTRINTITQDENGFLWLGTHHGLYKYDGYNFTEYLPSNSFQKEFVNDTIKTIFCAGKDTLWVGSQSGGLMLYDIRTGRFSRFMNADNKPLSVSGKTVYSVLDDPAGFRWVLTENGLDRIDKHFAVHHFLFSKYNNLPRNKSWYQSMVADPKGFIWIVFRGRLYRFNKQTRTLSRFRAQMPDNCVVLNVRSLGTGRIAVGTAQDGIFVIDTQSGQNFNLRQPIYHSNSSAVNHIVSMASDHRGNLWCGSVYGLHQIAPSLLAKTPRVGVIPEANILIDNVITSVFEDRSGVLWVGTLSGELKKITFKQQLFTQYLPDRKNVNTLVDTKVNAFRLDRHGILWIGTRKGICWFDPASKTFIPVPHCSENLVKLNEVSSLTESPDRNSMLIGTWSRTNAFSEYKYANKQFSYCSFKEPETNSIGSVVKVGKSYYVASFGEGLLQIDENSLSHTLSVYKKLTGNKLNLLYNEFYDSKGKLWLLGYTDGLGLLNPLTGRIQYFAHNNLSSSLSDNRVYSIHEDARKRIWVGTADGLNLYQPATNSFKRYYPDIRTGNNRILGLISDKYGNIWIMQDYRIARFNPEKNTFEFYNVQSWIPNCTFQNPAIGRDNTGMLYFGTKNNGFITVSPHQIPKMPEPVVAISGLMINDHRVLPDEKVNGRVILDKNINSVDRIELTYKENLVSLEFTALSYYNSSENRYAYKLEGLQDNWVYTSSENNNAVFSNLPPGKYVFKVKAANCLGIWDTTGKQLIIEVATPPWQTWWAIIFYLLLMVGVVLAVIRYNARRLKMVQALEFERFEKEQIQLLNRQKMQFFTNVSHEFRTPLTLISTYNRKILENVDSSQKIYPWVVNTQQNTEQLLLLVNQLLDFRKLEEHQTRLQVAEHDIVKFSYSLFQLFSDLSRLKEIDYRFKSNCESALVWFDKQKVERILFNLLSNAFKFTSEGETIHVSLTVDESESTQGLIIFEVSDTGLGIPLDEIHRIFDSFYQSASNVSDQNTGTGIGLALVKQLVELHRGTITVESEKGKGSLFTVCLPACKGSYDTQELANALAIENGSQPLFSQVPELEAKELVSEDAPQILVVEDNAELRHLLVHDLLCEYRVLEAGDGAEGLEMAWEHNPDLVISDVLMPEKDGFELCKELKNDLRSSHIPVILLTAMAVDEKKLEGFRSGADDYIEKPFSPELFILKIRNLLDTRRRLRILYAGDNQPEVQNVTLSPLDASFFEQAEVVIEQNLSNCDFDVDEFCKEMELGQKLVYRKIKSLTGLSISEYIRHERLKWAATLLREQRYTVQEVSYKVGFATPSYFAKCFKKQFDIAPKDYK